MKTIESLNCVASRRRVGWGEKNDFLRDAAHRQPYRIVYETKKETVGLLRIVWKPETALSLTITVAERTWTGRARSVVKFGKMVVGRLNFQTCNPPWTHTHTHRLTPTRMGGEVLSRVYGREGRGRGRGAHSR